MYFLTLNLKEFEGILFGPDLGDIEMCCLFYNVEGDNCCMWMTCFELGNDVQCNSSLLYNFYKIKV